MGAIISRFAPAPTGDLHLGHVVNAAFVWRETRARNGRILLRIEDHDRIRSRPAFEAGILDDLAWLGFEADEPLVRQSERGAIYEEALERLRRQGLVYACGCTRSDIAQADARRAESGRGREGLAVFASTASTGADPEQGDPEPAGLQTPELRYPGTCAHRALAEAPGLGLRVRLDPSVERFVDLRHGPQAQCPSAQCGDLLVRDRDGNWTYQFAAAVDDFVQGITLVVRGDDLLASTGRQIQLARLLGRTEPPQFLHHPLIMKPAAGGTGAPRQKLSKSDGDTGIRELRARGWTPLALVTEALSLIER